MSDLLYLIGPLSKSRVLRQGRGRTDSDNLRALIAEAEVGRRRKERYLSLIAGG